MLYTIDTIHKNAVFWQIMSMRRVNNEDILGEFSSNKMAIFANVHSSNSRSMFRINTTKVVVIFPQVSLIIIVNHMIQMMWMYWVDNGDIMGM